MRLSNLLAATAFAATSLTAVVPAALACGDDAAAPNKAAPADAKKVKIAIAGMSCGGCATAIHNALLKIDGVFVADVTFESGNAVVAFDPKKVTPDALVQAIQAAGYKPGKPTDA
ncbi:MAG: heavy-metal-associated domain-containing protein [Deltaproteobacteria bacterium]|nr:heavy-metal-associated domain-containing protein [Deltaproteobacteria bacterium]